VLWWLGGCWSLGTRACVRRARRSPPVLQAPGGGASCAACHCQAGLCALDAAGLEHPPHPHDHAPGTRRATHTHTRHVRPPPPHTHTPHTPPRQPPSRRLPAQIPLAAGLAAGRHSKQPGVPPGQHAQRRRCALHGWRSCACVCVPLAWRMHAQRCQHTQPQRTSAPPAATQTHTRARTHARTPPEHTHTQ
jgi:hypothetical protein